MRNTSLDPITRQHLHAAFHRVTNQGCAHTEEFFLRFVTRVGGAQAACAVASEMEPIRRRRRSTSDLPVPPPTPAKSWSDP
jgi:hypothetical protein